MLSVHVVDSTQLWVSSTLVSYLVIRFSSVSVHDDDDRPDWFYIGARVCSRLGLVFIVLYWCVVY